MSDNVKYLEINGIKVPEPLAMLKDAIDVIWNLSGENFNESLDKIKIYVKDKIILLKAIQHMLSSLDIFFPRKSILYDDVREILKLEGKFDFYERTEMNEAVIFDRLEYVQTHFEYVTSSDIEYAIIAGSVNCFKYFYLNNLIDPDDYKRLLVYAIYSNNYELIHTFEEKIEIEDGDLNAAICSHRNHIANYLIEKYGLKTDFVATIGFYNLDFLFESLPEEISDEVYEEIQNRCQIFHLHHLASFFIDYYKKPVKIKYIRPNIPIEIFIIYMESAKKIDDQKFIEGAFRFACRVNLSEHLEYIYNANYQISKELIDSCFDYCVAHNKAKSVKVLLEKFRGDNMSNDILFSCLCHRNADTLNVLIEHGADINAKDVTTKEPFLISCIYQAVDVSFVDILLEKGANFDVVDQNGNTPIMVAALHYRNEFVDKFAMMKYDFNHRNRYGQDIVDIANDTNNSDLFQLFFSNPSFVSVDDESVRSKFGDFEI